LDRFSFIWRGAACCRAQGRLLSFSVSVRKHFPKKALRYSEINGVLAERCAKVHFSELNILGLSRATSTKADGMVLVLGRDAGLATRLVWSQESNNSETDVACLRSEQKGRTFHGRSVRRLGVFNNNRIGRTYAGQHKDGCACGLAVTTWWSDGHKEYAEFGPEREGARALLGPLGPRGHQLVHARVRRAEGLRMHALSA
jgi:hypothetical protein